MWNFGVEGFGSCGFEHVLHLLRLVQIMTMLVRGGLKDTKVHELRYVVLGRWQAMDVRDFTSSDRTSR